MSVAAITEFQPLKILETSSEQSPFSSSLRQGKSAYFRQKKSQFSAPFRPLSQTNRQSQNGHQNTIHRVNYSKKYSPFQDFKWRRKWDSNPRYARTYDGFQDRSDQPLRHSSKNYLIGYPSILTKTKLIVKWIF